MTDEGCSDEWPQFRRIGETKGRLAALEDIRLRLIEMSDIAAAEALAVQIDALRRCLDYQQHVMVAMRARLAVRGMQSLPAIRLGVLKGGADRPACGAWRPVAPPAPAARCRAG